jgi:hypothetical protein
VPPYRRSKDLTHEQTERHSLPFWPFGGPAHRAHDQSTYGESDAPKRRSHVIMQPQGRLMEETTLENGLTILFFDRSKPIAGDRCQAQLLISIPLPIQSSWFEDDPEAVKDLPAFQSAFGSEIQYQRIKVRNFIDKLDLAPILDGMKEEFLKTNSFYLSNPSFAKKYVMSRFREWKRETTWGRLHGEAIRRADNEIDG